MRPAFGSSFFLHAILAAIVLLNALLSGDAPPLPESAVISVSIVDSAPISRPTPEPRPEPEAAAPPPPLKPPPRIPRPDALKPPPEAEPEPVLDAPPPEPVPIPEPEPVRDAPPAQPSGQPTEPLDLSPFFAAMRKRLESCWKIPVKEKLIGIDPIIRLRVELDRHGHIAAGTEPVWIDAGDHPYRVAAAERAVKALNRCAPYSLPSSHHALWRDIVFTFDLREASSGS